MTQNAKIQIEKAGAGKKGVMLMNRIGPSSSILYISNADGSDERALFEASDFDYHASFSPDGAWITFTSERNGDGNADVFRCRPDGSDVHPVVATPAVEDILVLSPDGTQAAFVSTADGFKANIWVIDLASGARRNLTGRPDIAGQADSPDSYLRPSWSPDGQWLVFSSDRNTAWHGHFQGHGWEHTQVLGIYAIRADGSGFRQISFKDDHAQGTPKFSPDGKRVVFYEMEREHNWFSRRPEKIANGVSQIVSVDFETGGDRIEHTTGPGVKICPQFMPNGTDVAYYLKGVGMDTNIRETDLAWMNYEGPKTGLYYTSGAPPVFRALRSPCWSPDGTKVIYEKVNFAWRAQGKPLFSWDKDWEYRSTDVFPTVSRQGKLAITEKQNGNSSIVTCNADGSNRKLVFDVTGKGLNPIQNKKGLAGAFQPTWSPEGDWIAFGLGPWFDARGNATAKIMRVKSDGSAWEDLTDGAQHAGFPSYSADGKSVVYRVWGKKMGLRIVDVETKEVRDLTTQIDNMPCWSPDGAWITFTREFGRADYHVCVIRPDGSDFKVLTQTRATDAHSVWTLDGKIAYSTAQYGFRDEAAIYDYTFQPYGQIMVMEADGSNKRLVTDSLWEDSMPCFIPNDFLT
ncbi:translocation protein TolB [Aquimixticola soesokkakensis]|uniref:Translocation protein TolB n=1 Tax=Aquimixticola soesokkakensis TaxID=1519096 RepID=A0A1Y5RW42_9RHOB|nr:PD40 domain-containing protein [Aquimixticola soesokkakensis]SLN26782.1 translocation protein TolB [Aquimixticola soesokkakensis]